MSVNKARVSIAQAGKCIKAWVLESEGQVGGGEITQ